jgi:aquaporin Z
MTTSRIFAAELFGTFWLVLGGCGTAVLAGHQVGWLGVALAFGVTVIGMAYAVGHISGCHLNPAVSVGLVAGGRMKASELGVYIPAQLVGAILASALLMFITRDMGTWEKVSSGLGGFATNAYGGSFYPVASAFLGEVALTFFFLFIILGSTDDREPRGFAGLVIGGTLTLIHLIGIPLTNLSVNPARSTGPALFVGGTAISQLWLFWAAPLLGAALAGLFSRWLQAHKSAGAAS